VAGEKPEQRADSVRRRDFAVEWLHNSLCSKIGKSRAYGDVIVKVRLQAGEITAVKVTDEADYK